MKIQGQPVGEVIWAIMIILWGLIRYAAIGVLIVGAIWLVMNSILLFVFIITVVAIAKLKVKW
jgi:hypothetical protein